MANLQERPDLLGAIMKSPGPFYQFEDGSFFQDSMSLQPDRYLDVLADVEVFEVSGGVDTEGLAAYCQENLF